jgi:hypothetical protein
MGQKSPQPEGSQVAAQLPLQVLLLLKSLLL